MHGLSQIDSLREVKLVENNVTDRGIQQLARLSQLNSLRIMSAEGLSVASIDSLLGHENLEQLSLVSAPIRHAQARRLKTMPSLSDVEVGMDDEEIHLLQRQRNRRAERTSQLSRPGRRLLRRSFPNMDSLESS